MTKKQVIPEALLLEAKSMYMEYVPVKTISEQLGVARTTLQYHATRHWDFERNLARAEMFKNFSEQKKVTMTTMSEAALKIMTRAMENLADGDTMPTLQQANQASAILESIDKILRLDDNKPTDITESRPTTTVELKKRLELDPFSNVEWIDKLPKDKDEEPEEQEA
jgi:hypothetical protein